MTRILLVGDTHASIGHVQHVIFPAAKRNHCDCIVQLGDFGYWPRKYEFHLEVDGLAVQEAIDFYWLDGNHEDFDSLEQDVDMSADSPQRIGGRLFYLARGCTWEWGDRRFMSFGGAHSIDRDMRREGVSWFRRELPSKREVDRALGRGSVDVLLTHDAPDGVVPGLRQLSGDHEALSSGNRRAISAIVEATRPKLVVHGHYHLRYTCPGPPRVEGLSCEGAGRRSYVVLDTEGVR